MIVVAEFHGIIALYEQINFEIQANTSLKQNTRRGSYNGYIQIGGFL